MRAEPARSQGFTDSAAENQSEEGKEGGRRLNRQGIAKNREGTISSPLPAFYGPPTTGFVTVAIAPRALLRDAARS